MQSPLWVSVLAFGTALLAAGAAQATMVSGTATFADNGPTGNGLLFTGSADNAALASLNLTLDTPVTLDNFLTIQSHDDNFQFFGKVGATDNVATDFTFTLPDSGSGIIDGKGKETVGFFFGSVDSVSGKITWDNPGLITFADGAELSISLSQAKFDPSGWPDQTVYSDATFELTKDPTAVPEPAALSVLACGLLGLGMVQRRRRAG